MLPKVQTPSRLPISTRSKVATVSEWRPSAQPGLPIYDFNPDFEVPLDTLPGMRRRKSAPAFAFTQQQAEQKRKGKALAESKGKQQSARFPTEQITKGLPAPDVRSKQRGPSATKEQFFAEKDLPFLQQDPFPVQTSRPKPTKKRSLSSLPSLIRSHTESTFGPSVARAKSSGHSQGSWKKRLSTGAENVVNHIQKAFPQAPAPRAASARIFHSGTPITIVIRHRDDNQVFPDDVQAAIIPDDTRSHKTYPILDREHVSGRYRSRELMTSAELREYLWIVIAQLDKADDVKDATPADPGLQDLRYAAETVETFRHMVMHGGFRWKVAASTDSDVEEWERSLSGATRRLRREIERRTGVDAEARAT